MSAKAPSPIINPSKKRNFTPNNDERGSKRHVVGLHHQRFRTISKKPSSAVAISQHGKLIKTSTAKIYPLSLIRIIWTVISIIINSLKSTPKGLVSVLEELEIEGDAETIQTTAWLRLARILGRVLEIWADLVSLKLQWKALLCNIFCVIFRMTQKVLHIKQHLKNSDR